MRKPLNARSTQFVKIQTSARATLGANPASSASRHPIRRPFSPAHGVSLSTRHCGSARAGQTHPLRVNATPCLTFHGRHPPSRLPDTFLDVLKGHAWSQRDLCLREVEERLSNHRDLRWI